jgi:hypothetical protein
MNQASIVFLLLSRESIAWVPSCVLVSPPCSRPGYTPQPERKHDETQEPHGEDRSLDQAHIGVPTSCVPRNTDFFTERFSSGCSGSSTRQTQPGRTLDLAAFADTTSPIFTSVPVSSMLEEASAVKNQKEPPCRISDTRKEPVEKDV